MTRQHQSHAQGAGTVSSHPSIAGEAKESWRHQDGAHPAIWPRYGYIQFMTAFVDTRPTVHTGNVRRRTILALVRGSPTTQRQPHTTRPRLAFSSPRPTTRVGNTVRVFFGALECEHSRDDLICILFEEHYAGLSRWARGKSVNNCPWQRR
jgi:hypothetical protein